MKMINEMLLLFSLLYKGFVNFFSEFTSNFMTDLSQPFNIFWILSAFIIALVYFAYSMIKRKTSLNRVQSFLKSSRFKFELKKDFFYLSLRFIYKPIIFGYFLLNHRQVIQWVTEYTYLAQLQSIEPVFYLDPVYGIYVLALLNLLYMDFASYLVHLFYHKVPWLWKFHATHHRATVLNPLTKDRIHPVEYFVDTIILKPVLFAPGIVLLASAFHIGKDLDYKYTMALLNYVFLSFVSNLRHSHIRLNYGKFLSYIFISPHMHQAHHSRNRVHRDVNLGVMLSVWDVIFGTFYNPKRNERFKFGLSNYQNRAVQSYTYDLWVPFKEIFADIKFFFQNLKMFTVKFVTKSKQSSNKQLSSPNLYKSAGFTLIEMMISSAIASLIFLTGAYISVNMAVVGLKQSKISEAEQDLDRLMYTLKYVASLAVNVRLPTPANLDLNGRQTGTGGAGYVRVFNYLTDASMGALPSATLMFFARENRLSNMAATTTTSLFRPTGVFFVRKNEVFDNTRRGSRIVIDLGASDATGVLTPDDGDLVIERVSDFTLDQPQFSRGNILNSIRVTATSIYPTSNAKAGYDCLGPRADITAGLICNDNRTTPFKTVTKVFTLKFLNNRRNSPMSIGEFQNGLYIFRPTYGN